MRNLHRIGELSAAGPPAPRKLAIPIRQKILLRNDFQYPIAYAGATPSMTTAIILSAHI